MTKFIFLSGLFIIGIITALFLFNYYVPYSEGERAGKLIKISHKGFIFKTYEGEISQGVAGELKFIFSAEESKKEVIEKLKKHQGQNVSLTYIERFWSIPFLGDTNHFITDVKKQP